MIKAPCCFTSTVFEWDLVPYMGLFFQAWSSWNSIAAATERRIPKLALGTIAFNFLELQRPATEQAWLTLPTASVEANSAVVLAQLQLPQFAVSTSSSLECQVSVWQSATLLPISCKSVQPVPAWVKRARNPVRQWTPLSPRCLKPFQVKVGVETRIEFGQWAFRRRRRTR